MTPSLRAENRGLRGIGPGFRLPPTNICGHFLRKAPFCWALTKCHSCQNSVWSRLHATNNLAESFQNRLPALWQAPPGESPTSEALDKLKILSQRNERMDNPKRFDGTNWYAGSLLLIGDLVD